MVANCLNRVEKTPNSGLTGSIGAVKNYLCRIVPFTHPMKLNNLAFSLLIAYSLFSVKTIFAEPACQFMHYSTGDGLPQYTIMDMLQDRKGFMWFGTWDGLSKYDGYRFRNFKVQPGDSYVMRSNRIEALQEDHFGNIYIRSYDGEAHCFHPGTETFQGIHPVDGLGKNTFFLREIKVMPSGRVWLLSDLQGCVCVLDSFFNRKAYNQNLGNLKGKSVNTVLEDRSGNTWLLTDNGLGCIPAGKTGSTAFLYENNIDGSVDKQKFYAALELEKELLFGSDKGHLWKYQKKDGKFVLLPLDGSSDIIDLKLLPDGSILIVTSSGAFFRLDTRNWISVPISIHGFQLPAEAHVTNTYLDKYQNLWIGLQHLGIWKLQLKTGELKYYFIQTEDESATAYPPRIYILEDKNNRVWVQPRGGGFSLYNPLNDKLEPFYNDPRSSNWRFSNILHSVTSDRQGNLWMCTRSHGLEKVVFDNNFFQTVSVGISNHAVVAADVRCVFQDRQETIFVCTKNLRVIVYDKDLKQIGQLDPNGKISPNATFKSSVYCMAQDRKGRIWAGMKGGGIMRLTGDGKKRQWKTETFRHDENDPYSLSEDKVYSIYEDRKGRIWVGTYDGGLNLIQENPAGRVRFISHRNNLRNYPAETGSRVRYITEDRRGHICLGTTGGLIMFNPNSSAPENISFHTFYRRPSQKNSLSGNDVHGICITKKGEMFLVTFGGGVNKALTYDKQGYPASFQAYTRKEGLPSDVTLSIVEDSLGMLWISSENNLLRLNPETMLFETFAEIKRFMTTASFSEASTCKLRSGRIVFGFSNGLVCFQPQHISSNLFIPRLAFTDFQLFNKEVSIGGNTPLQKSLDDLSVLKLKHNQNFFSIEYAALDFQEPENILYMYKLEGFDEDWQYARKQRYANYTNIPKGSYVFRVKSTNSQGIWVNNERKLTIRVMPSFWQTIFAYILYFLLFAGLVMLCVYILIVIYRLRGDVLVEKKISEMKLRFFTDISHEIRTPLTMITAPVEHILHDKRTPENIKQELSIVSHNTSRLLRLVNQILDFRKIQDQHLRISEIDLGNAVGEICSDFTEMADKQQLKFEFINLASGEKIWVDLDSLEKMVINLLSNAFKFTPAGKGVRVTVYQNEDSVCLQVADNGSGISKDLQKVLFTRFASFNPDKNKPSTGIGLSMVKELADKHGAKVTVDSESNRGSIFTISFRKGFEHLGKDMEIILSGSEGKQMEEVPAPTETIVQTKETAPPITKTARISILLVEDDEDLRNFMITLLATDYEVLTAGNGLEALKIIRETPPDFVVSDVMMPEMDGFELLKNLRSNVETSHLPILLLTAKTTIESRLQGLTYGADDYITKPFSVAYFQARIANLIKQRKRLQEVFSNSTIADTGFHPKPFHVTPQDEILMENIIQTIENNMDNSDFTVEDLGQAVGMSRSSFFNKVKSLTGLSPVEFIRDIRIKRASQILATGEFLIKEVAYMTGFSDARYFGECFKTKYGITPAEFKKRQ
jgi:signal transduction histidine kinase/DNA-binding response OmpR family regulator/ligand-binding sensor domain-containing protein